MRMSEFWKRKMRTFIILFDTDKDGVMSMEDWMGMARLFVKSQKGDKQKEEYYLTQFDKSWAQFLKYVENKNRFTIDDFVNSIAKQRYEPELIKSHEDLMRAFFSLMNVNCDGYLQEDEFERMHVQFGLEDAAWAKETFKTLDVNDDGKLSIEEYIDGVKDFFQSEDENSTHSHLLFGPLVD